MSDNDNNNATRTGWPRIARSRGGRFGAEFALSALEALWTALDAQGPGLDDGRDLPFVSVAVDLDMSTGECAPVVTLTAGWFRALFGGGRVDVTSHAEPGWLTVAAVDLGIRWRATGYQDALPLVAQVGGSATLQEHDPERWAAQVEADRLLEDVLGPAGILRPLPPVSATWTLLSSTDDSTPVSEPADAPGASQGADGTLLD